jgi:ABC-type oligopeptide transport system substrate-binding subunit
LSKRLLSLLLCAVLVLGLTGCGGGKLNSFTWFVEDIPSNLDPQVAQSSADVIACTHLYSGLFQKDADGKLVNACCESYTVSSNKLLYTFKLKSGLTYEPPKGSDKAYPLTAQDFVFAFRRVFDASTASPYAASFAAIQNSSLVLNGTAPAEQLGVSASDSNTLAIHLSTADENFLEKLTLPGAMPCSEAFFNSTKGSYGLNRKSILTNGNFTLYNWTENGLFLRRTADGETINSLRLVQNTDATNSSPETLVQNEKCSAILDNSSDPTSLQAIPYSDTTWCLVFNCNSVFANASLRKALAADARAADLPKDSARFTAVDGIIPAGVMVDGYDYREECGKVSAPAVDAAASFAQGLAEVGVDNLKGIHILVPESANADFVQAVNSLWQEHYSLFFSVDTVPDDTFWERYQAGNYTLAFAPLSLSQSDPLSMLSPFAGPVYPNPEFESLVRQASAQTGSEKCRLLAEAENLLVTDAEVTPLYAQEKRLLIAPSISGLRFDPYGPLIDVNFATQKT